MFLEIKHSKLNGLNHAVNLSTGSVIQQEVQKSCSEQDMSHISNSLNVKTSQPKLPGKRKYPGKSEEKVMNWKEIILNHMMR